MRLLDQNASKAEVGGTTNARAYEAYLQGLYSVNQGEKEATLRKALAAFDQAIAVDPNYARAHAGRARTLGTLASNGYEPFESGFASAREAAERARALEPELAEAWLRLAYMTYAVDLDIAKAQRTIRAGAGPGSRERGGPGPLFQFRGRDRADREGHRGRLEGRAARPDRTATSRRAGYRILRGAALRRGARRRRVRAERLDPNYPTRARQHWSYALLETGDLEGAACASSRRSRSSGSA